MNIEFLKIKKKTISDSTEGRTRLIVEICFFEPIIPFEARSEVSGKNATISFVGWL